jgi:hypothetical protein
MCWFSLSTAIFIYSICYEKKGRRRNKKRRQVMRWRCRRKERRGRRNLVPTPKCGVD